MRAALSGYMLPGAVVNYLENGKGGDTELVSQTVLLLSITPSFSDRLNCLLGQFCRSLLRSSRSIVAALRFPVLHVIGVGSEEQMSGVAAGRVVAGVQDTHGVWDRSIGYSPDNSVRVVGHTINANLAVTGTTARSAFSAVPEPALRRLSNYDLSPQAGRYTDVIAQIAPNGTIDMHLGLTSGVSRGGMLRHRRPIIVPIFKAILRTSSLAAGRHTVNPCEKEWHCHPL